MPYTKEISRKSPGCFFFLLDQSESMEDPFGGNSKAKQKADELAVIINKLIHNLSIRCAKSSGIYDYFHVGILGYGDDTCKPGLGGALEGRYLVPISELADTPLRIDEKPKNTEGSSDGDSGETIKFPVWYDAVAKGGTPMCAAFKEASNILKNWIDQNPDSFPPIVINITDGDATDGDLVEASKSLTSLETKDGNVLLFNIHLSGEAGLPIELPGKPEGLTDKFSKNLFEASSVLTPFMIVRARELGMTVDDTSRGFIFNAQPLQVINFLDIGTRPSKLR